MGKILLVDDHPDIVRLLQISLKPEGHTILTAHDGKEALRLVNEERPDVVVLDVVMPEVDGFRVLNRIKTDPELCGTTVVMLTVKDQPEEIALGVGIGADFYLSKPFKPTEVTSLIRRILPSGEAGDGRREA
jgi:two-component system, OmpR family, alkaline phosphatase synthesis response regulator PhoP